MLPVNPQVPIQIITKQKCKLLFILLIDKPIIKYSSRLMNP